jgi:hypothetical protein
MAKKQHAPLDGSLTAGRYETLSQKRRGVLDVARECAALTLPHLAPPEGTTPGTRLTTPNQSIGAFGTLSLAAKLLNTLFPPNEPFFRLDVDDFTMMEMTQNTNMGGEIQKGLSSLERMVTLEFESGGYRVGVHTAAVHLVCSGNCLVYVNPEGGLKVWTLENYVVVRDPAGNPIEIILRESVAYEALPEDVQRQVLEDQKAAKDAAPGTNNLKLYTHLVRRSADKWDALQSVDKTPIETTRGGYASDDFPFLPLRLYRVDGEDYGRGHVESYFGDLNTIDRMSKALRDFAAGASKVVPLVNPNGVTNEEDLADAENFEFTPGRADDITFLHINKYADFQVVKSLLDDLTRRIGIAFLVGVSIQRSGERVTAEEIRTMIGQLEETMGGVYALMAQELQLPVIAILLKQTMAKKKMPALPKGMVKPVVTTGVDALSRANNLNKLDRLVAGLAQLFGPEAVASEVSPAAYIRRRAAELSVSADDIFYTDEEKQAKADARAQQEMMMKMGGPAINAMGGMAQASMAQQPQPEE